MSDSNHGAISGGSEGGVIGEHPGSPPLHFFVGPATESQFNTLRLPLIPILCWKVQDIRFAFDSSFVTYNADPLTNPADPTSDPTARTFANEDIRDELKLLASQIKQNPGCPLSVFGHADPVGPPVDPDGYNKALSGRRATSIYALLISATQAAKAAGLWQGIASRENWGPKQAGIMQQATGLPAGTSMTALISAYLPKLVPPEFAALQIGPANFLAQGADSQGKGDYQGCSSFNPLLIFSQQKEDRFAGADDKNSEAYAARNLANAPNRRVMVLIFNKGSKVDPAKWPCPSAAGDKAGCIKRFWSDGEKRRHSRLANVDRKYDKTQDTFACRFYDRLARTSPCDKVLRIYKIRLFDPYATPLPGSSYTVSDGTQTLKGVADKDAFATVINLKVPAEVEVKWQDPRDHSVQYSLNVHVDVEGDDDAAAKQRLHNLGYENSPGLEDNVRAFQADHQKRFPDMQPTGKLDQATRAALKSVNADCDPSPRPRDDMDSGSAAAAPAPANGGPQNG